MLPKVNAGLFFMPTPDGVYLRGNRGTLKLRGAQIYAWVERLIPYLNGGYTLEELTAGLSSDKKATVVNLITTLEAHHFLKDVSQDWPHTLNSMELQTYAPEIDFIASFQSSAASRFESFRNKRLLLIGSGLSFTSLVKAALQIGVKQISVLPTSESDLIPVAQPDVLDLFARNDPAQTVLKVEVPDWEDSELVWQALQPYDAILHLSDRFMGKRAQLLNKLCIAHKKPLLQAFFAEDRAWIGPLVGSDQEACWECAWRRLHSNQVGNQALSVYAVCDNDLHNPLSRFFATPAAIITANRLIFEIFKYFTQAGPLRLVENMIGLNLETLTSQSFTVFSHPDCQADNAALAPTAEQFLTRIQELVHQPPIEVEEFFQHVEHCVDSRLGLFTSIEEQDFVQMPLSISKVIISHPLLRTDTNIPAAAFGTGLDVRNARLNALRRACEIYAAHVIDRRKLLSFQVAQKQAYPLVPAERLLVDSSLSSREEGWTWVLNLHTYQPCLIPAELVFSSLRESARKVQNERGIGSGMNWAEALCKALYDWNIALTIATLKDRRESCLCIDLTAVPLSAEGAHLYRSLKTVDAGITIYDITGALRIPTFAVCCGKETVVYTSHYDPLQALEEGLETALRHYQSRQMQQPDYGSAPVPPFPMNLRSQQITQPDWIVPKEWAVQQSWLLQRFQEAHLQALVVPLHGDPVLEQAFPFVVRILILRA